MRITELDSVITEVLEQEARKLIKEQVSDTDHMINSVKSFHSLSGLINKIDEIEDAGIDNFSLLISIHNLTPEELVDACGGTSLGEAQKNLMQGLHHDLEDNGFGSDFDIDIETLGDEKALHLMIRITENNDKTLEDTEMKETKNTDPAVTGKKDIILGGKEMDEQWEEAAAELAPVLQDAAAQYIGGKVADKLSSSDDKEEDVDEATKDKTWMQDAVNPKHEGYCTPMSKPACTKKRKTLAKTFKKMAKQKNESTEKRVITLSEAEMNNFIKKIILEAVVAPSGGVLPGGVPGIDITKKVHSDDGKENDAALEAVEAKIKKYLTFKGNDNPKFPHQIGGEKVARQNSKKEDEIVDDNRGGTMADLTYDQKPSKEFEDRAKMSLVGASEMGNSPDAINAIKTDVGDNIAKRAERVKDIKREEPRYKKEAVPVKTKPEKDPERGLKDPVVEKDIERMKQMSEYKEKTQ